MSVAILLKRRSFLGNIHPIDYQTKTTFLLPNNEGKNILTFQFQYPKYPHNLAILYAFDEEFSPKTDIGSIGLFISNITF